MTETRAQCTRRFAIGSAQRTYWLAAVPTVLALLWLAGCSNGSSTSAPSATTATQSQRRCLPLDSGAAELIIDRSGIDLQRSRRDIRVNSDHITVRVDGFAAPHEVRDETGVRCAAHGENLVVVQLTTRTWPDAGIEGRPASVVLVSGRKSIDLTSVLALDDQDRQSLVAASVPDVKRITLEVERSTLRQAVTLPDGEPIGDRFAVLYRDPSMPYVWTEPVIERDLAHTLVWNPGMPGSPSPEPGTTALTLRAAALSAVTPDRSRIAAPGRAFLWIYGTSEIRPDSVQTSVSNFPVLQPGKVTIAVAGQESTAAQHFDSGQYNGIFDGIWVVEVPDGTQSAAVSVTPGQLIKTSTPVHTLDVDGTATFDVVFP